MDQLPWNGAIESPSLCGLSTKRGLLWTLEYAYDEFSLCLHFKKEKTTPN